MKKKIWIPIVAVIILLAILFVPIPQASYDDGGTREWKALTYKIVDWNRIYEDGTYVKTRIYTGADRFKSIDELWMSESVNAEHSFKATVLDIDPHSVLVEPLEGESEAKSCDEIRFDTRGMDIDAKVGSIVKVTYNGYVMESDPAQIDFVKWELEKDLRHMNYEGEWLDKETTDVSETDGTTDVVIREIYKDCFFATPVIPMPHVIKVNAALSDEWCVGDQVLITFENMYYDSQDYRQECDLKDIAVSDFELEPGVAYKPVIYLYPEQKMEVSVKLNLDGELNCTYPAYDNGWKVTADPDGTLTDANGQIYSYLYWEGETYAKWDMIKGFCVKGEDTAAFLERALAKLGLTRREANEFIVYWLPLMQENSYNIISFQTDVYANAAKLQVTPNPDTLIRVFMTYQSSDRYVDMEEQKLTAPQRAGFTVVEWGGTEVSR